MLCLAAGNTLMVLRISSQIFDGYTQGGTTCGAVTIPPIFVAGGTRQCVWCDITYVRSSLE